MKAFLRGPRVALHATAAAPVAGDDAWLDAGARQGDEILMAQRASDGSETAILGLTSIDWVGRRATLCAGCDDGSPPERASLAEALALLVAYARDELALERLDAKPLHATARDALEELGFRASERGWLTMDLPDPLVPR